MFGLIHYPSSYCVKLAVFIIRQAFTPFPSRAGMLRHFYLLAIVEGVQAASGTIRARVQWMREKGCPSLARLLRVSGAPVEVRCPRRVARVYTTTY